MIEYPPGRPAVVYRHRLGRQTECGQFRPQALTAALFARERTGRGQHIRLSMLESVLSFLWASDMGAYTFADKPVPVEQDGSFIDLIYETADGFMTIATNSNAEWQALCHAVGHPEWIEDERFATPIGRSEYINERLELVQSPLPGRFGVLDPEAHRAAAAPLAGYRLRADQAQPDGLHRPHAGRVRHLIAGARPDQGPIAGTRQEAGAARDRPLLLHQPERP